jgi:hypothetical protein
MMDLEHQRPWKENVMKCANPDCNRDIGLVTYQRGWFSKRRYCSKHCRNAFVADAPNLQQLRKGPLAAPPVRPEAAHLAGCDRNLADASASVAAMQARIKSLSSVDKSEMCTATRFYFLEVVKARAVSALCKSGGERERELSRLDDNISHINDDIAARCL